MDYPFSFYSCTDTEAYGFTTSDVGYRTTSTTANPHLIQEYESIWYTAPGTIYDCLTNTFGETISYEALGFAVGSNAGMELVTESGNVVSIGIPALYGGGTESSWKAYPDSPLINETKTNNSNATAYGTFINVPAGYVGPITQSDLTSSYIVSELLWETTASVLEIAFTTIAGFLDYSTTSIADNFGAPIFTGAPFQWQSTSTSTTYLETYWADTFITSETTRTYSGSTEADSVGSVVAPWTNFKSTGHVLSYGVGQTSDTGYFYGSANAISFVPVSDFASPIEELPSVANHSTSYTFIQTYFQYQQPFFIYFSENTTDREIALWKENVFTRQFGYPGSDYAIFPTVSSSYSSAYEFTFPQNTLVFYFEDYQGTGSGPITSFLVPAWCDVSSTAEYNEMTSQWYSVFPLGFSSFGSYTQQIGGLGNLCTSQYTLSCKKSAVTPYLRVWESYMAGSESSMTSHALSGLGANWYDLTGTYYSINFGTISDSIIEFQYSTGYQHPQWYVPDSFAQVYKVINASPPYLQNGKSITFEIAYTSAVSSSKFSSFYTTLIELTDGPPSVSSFETSYTRTDGEILNGSYTFRGIVAFTSWSETDSSSGWSHFSNSSSFVYSSCASNFIECGTIFSAISHCYIPA